jgi:membrane-associated HD superfamily phosphohydrolase
MPPALVLILFLLAFTIFPASPAIPDYQVGETSRVDVVTPIPLMIVDRQKTSVLRRSEGQKVPGIFRSHPDAIDQAEANLRETFNSTREEFLESMEIHLQQRKLTMLATTRTNFGEFVAAFQEENKIFPLNTNLARVWAVGASDDPYITEWVARVRKVMHQQIRSDNLPSEARQGPAEIRLIIVRSTNTTVTLDNVEQMSTRASRNDFVPLSTVRKQLQTNLPPEDQATIGKFLALFVRENVAFDEALTRQHRARQTQALWAADTYDAGSFILKTGDIVTTKNKAALDELRAKNALQTVKELAVEESLKTQLKGDQLQAQLQTTYQKSLEKTLMILGGTIAALALALCFFFWQGRGKRNQTLLPAQTGRQPPWIQTQGETALLSCPACSETIIVDLPSEKRSSLPAKPGMAIPLWLKEFIRKSMGILLWQRKMLLDTQQQAEMEVVAFEKRLAKMNAPLQDRICAYEKLIADLQSELAAERQQSAGVIQAQIDLTRQRLDRERKKATENQPR